MEHQLDLENKKYKQWVKAGLGLKYLGQGLTPFCDEIVKRQHNDILDNIKRTKNLSIVTCDQCILNKLKPDHVQTGNKQCPLGQANCNCLHPSGKQPCPNDVCGAIYDHIVTNYGSTPPAPYWRNTLAKSWCTDPWSVAKCFINAPVYGAFMIMDCTRLLRLIINNQGFHNHIQCTINGTDVFSKVLQYRYEIFHSSSMELEENTANTYIDDMIAILQDGKELKTRQYAQNAVQQLLMLKKNDVTITAINELCVIVEGMRSISFTLEEVGSKLPEVLNTFFTTEDVENKLPVELEKIPSIEPTSVVTIRPVVLALQEMKELKTAQSRQRVQYNYIASKHMLEFGGPIPAPPRDMRLPRFVIHAPDSPFSQGTQTPSFCQDQNQRGLLNRYSGWQVAGSDISSGFFEDDAEITLDISEDTSENNLTEKVIKFIREIKGSFFPETLNEGDIRARLKQLVHAGHGNSMLELMEMLIDLVKRKENQDESSEDSTNTSDTDARPSALSDTDDEKPEDDTDDETPEDDTDDETPKELLVKDIEELLKEINRSDVPQTINREDIQAQVKQFKHSQSRSSHALMRMIIGIVKQNDTSAERCKESMGISGTQTPSFCQEQNQRGTPLNENQRIQKEIKSSPIYRAVGHYVEELACQEAVVETPLNENEQVKAGIISLSKGVEAFGYQEGKIAPTPLNETLQIKKETKSSPKYQAVGELANQGGVTAITSIVENQQIKKEIKSDDYEEFAYQRDDDEWISFLHSGNKNDANALLGRGKFPNKSTLNEICRLYKVNSEVTCFICDAVCEYIKSKDENIVDVWAAYRVQNKNEVAFIVCLQDSQIKEETTDIGHLNQIVDYTLIKRIVGEFSNEGIDIINRNETSDTDFNDETYCKLRECVARYSVDLFREHKYVSVISVCSKRSVGYGSSWELKPENCIVLYVHTKHYIPIDEEPFKTHYGGIPVDVREGAFIPFGRTATDYLEHLQMGCQISGDELSGTLGCFLDHPQYGVCGLTSAHVLLNPRELKKLKDSGSGSLNWPLNDMCKRVYQPAFHSVGHTVQLIYKEGSEHSSGMELAVFKITSRHPKTSDFPDTVTGSSMVSSIQYEHWRICCPTRLNPNMRHVRKFGSKTEFRNGIIEFDTMSVKSLDRYPLRMKDFNITLYKQIEVRPQTSSLKFADIGDSGALVFLDGDNDSEHTCIGIVEGGTTYGTVVVTPIVPILKELNVSSLKSFEAETNLSEIHGKIDSVENNLSTKMQSMHQELSTIGSVVLRIRDAVLPNPAPPQNADLNSASSNTNADVS